MTRLVVAPLLVAMFVLGSARWVQAYPEPAVVSPSWALDFTFETPRTLAVKGIDGSIQWFWYMPYKVVNASGEDRLFVPEITLATDAGDIFAADEGIPATVYNKIREQENNTLIESPMQVVGKILQGEDYAKESVAVWPAFTQDVDQFSVFVGGLSGENVTLEAEGDQTPVLLRRTTMLLFKTPGNHVGNPQQQPIEWVSSTDVMR